MREKAKNIISFLFRIFFSIALLGYLSTKIDIEKTIGLLKSVKIHYLLYAAIVFSIVNMIILWRWYILIRALDLVVSLQKVVRYFFIGLFGNLFLPSSIGGDLIKIVGLCKNSSQKPRVVASVLLDRLSGFAAIVLVAVCAFTAGNRFIDDKSVFIPIVLMGGVSALAAVVLFNESIYSFCCRIFNRLPRVKKNLMHMHYDIMLLKNKQRAGWIALMMSCFSQVILAFIFFLIAKSLHQDIKIIYFLIFIPIICVVSAFPSIGGLGVREAGTVYLFAKIGVDSGVAMSMSLMLFLFMVINGLIGGLVYVFTISSGRVQYHPSDTGINSESA